jgi:PleD family two-component response regulator
MQRVTSFQSTPKAVKPINVVVVSNDNKLIAKLRDYLMRQNSTLVNCAPEKGVHNFQAFLQTDIIMVDIDNNDKLNLITAIRTEEMKLILPSKPIAIISHQATNMVLTTTNIFFELPQDFTEKHLNEMLNQFKRTNSNSNSYGICNTTTTANSIGNATSMLTTAYSPKASSGIPTSSQSELIMVVDDDGFNLRIFGDFLEKCNKKAIFANNGLEAVTMFEKDYSKIKVIFMDCEMPVMNGLEATARIRKFCREKKIAKCTDLRCHSQCWRKIRE